jgi:hypothetical protein
MSLMLHRAGISPWTMTGVEAWRPPEDPDAGDMKSSLDVALHPRVLRPFPREKVKELAELYGISKLFSTAWNDP